MILFLDTNDLGFGMLLIAISQRNGFILATHQATPIMWVLPDAQFSH